MKSLINVNAFGLISHHQRWISSIHWIGIFILNTPLLLFSKGMKYLFGNPIRVKSTPFLPCQARHLTNVAVWPEYAKTCHQNFGESIDKNIHLQSKQLSRWVMKPKYNVPCIKMCEWHQTHQHFIHHGQGYRTVQYTSFQSFAFTRLCVSFNTV